MDQQEPPILTKIPTKKVYLDNEIPDKVSKQSTTGNNSANSLIFGKHPNSQHKLTNSMNFVDKEKQVFCVRFDQNDENLAIGYSDGNIKIYNCNTRKHCGTFQGYSGVTDSPTTALRWRPKVQGKAGNVLTSVNADGSISTWHVPSGVQVNRTKENKNSIFCLDYNLDGSKFATAGKDYHDYPGGQSFQRGHTNEVFAMVFLGKDDPNVIVTGGWDSNLMIWDLREKESIGTIHGPSLSGDGLDYQNGLILTGSYRNSKQLQLWDFKTRKLFKDVEWSPGKDSLEVYTYSAQFNKLNKNTIAAGSSGLGQLVIFNAKKDYMPCASIDRVLGGVYSLDQGNVTNRIAFGGGSGEVHILNHEHPDII